MNTILCPTDFSKNAANAAEYACALGENFNSRIILFHVYESPAIYSETDFVILREAEALIKETAVKKMETMQSKLSKKYRKVTVETAMELGAAGNEVIAASNKLNADMIVMGTTGTSKVERLLLGSTTAKVIRKSDCPVLCIPREAEFKGIKKIVFATDLKEDNISSAMTLTPFATNFDAEIIFVFVDDKHLLHADKEIERMTRQIRKQVKYPKISGYISKNTSITKGIEYFLEKFPADMLAMFSHEKHFPETLFNQSITKILSHQTRIPLLALKVADRPVM